MDAIIIGQSCSPSKIIGQEKIEVREYVVSHGQTVARYYAKTLINKTQKFHHVELYDGRRKEININFTIERNPVYLVKVVTDETDYWNYHVESYKSFITTRYYLFQENEEYVINSKITSDDSYKEREINKIVDSITL